MRTPPTRAPQFIRTQVTMTAAPKVGVGAAAAVGDAAYNLVSSASQAVVNLSLWPGIAGKRWRLSDVLNGDTYIREGDTMLRPGLYVELGPYQSHILRFDRQP